MEIKELTAFFVDKETNILDVTFRLIDDSDDIIRQDQIDYDLAEEYGYSIVPNHLSIPDDESIDNDIDEFEDIDVDKIELINFLTEYYTVNPNLLLQNSRTTKSIKSVSISKKNFRRIKWQLIMIKLKN